MEFFSGYHRHSWKIIGILMSRCITDCIWRPHWNYGLCIGNHADMPWLGLWSVLLYPRKKLYSKTKNRSWGYQQNCWVVFFNWTGLLRSSVWQVILSAWSTQVNYITLGVCESAMFWRCGQEFSKKWCWRRATGAHDSRKNLWFCFIWVVTFSGCGLYGRMALILQ